MLKSLMISDFHAKESGQFSWLTYDYKLPLLKQTLLDWGSRVDRIYIPGDFFHMPDPSHKLVNGCADAFSVLGEHIIKVFFLIGNHDPLVGYSSAIKSFALGTKCNSKGMALVYGNEAYFDDEAKVVLCSWKKGNLPKAPAPDWDLVTHVQVKDWIKFSDDGYALAELDALGYNRIWTGDFHRHIDAGKVVSIGTFGASDFSDEGLTSGFLVVNEDGSFTRNILDYPVFHTFRAGHLIPLSKVKGNIVKVISDGPANLEIFKDSQPLKLIIEQSHNPKEAAKVPEFQSLEELEAQHKANWGEPEKEQYDLL